MKALQELLEEGAREKVFRAARAEVSLRGQTVFSGGTVGPEAVFDLASITKVMSTTALLCHFAAQGRVGLEQSVSEFLPGAGAGEVTLADLLTHRSGLPAFMPFFARAVSEHPELLDTPRLPSLASLRARVRDEVLARVLVVRPERPAARAAVYSDLGFLVLGAVLERVGQADLDVLFARHLVGPLGFSRSAGFRRISAALPSTGVVSTGGTRPRAPAPGQEGLWQTPTAPSVDGEVDDDNAWVMDGVAGHAGLFATAGDVSTFARAIISGAIRAPAPWAADPLTPGSTRTWGFDTPSAEAPSCGAHFAAGARSGDVIGHLGFTGTSVWIDLRRALSVVLLTDRVVYGRANIAIRTFRPRFHDAVLTALASELHR